MHVTNRNIVCLSTHYWNERWFRKQEFMSRFARENRVLFVEPSFSMARAPEAHLAEVASNRFFIGRLTPAGHNLTLFKPPRGLPKWTDPRVQMLTYRWYGGFIRRAMRRLGFRDALLWVYRPSYLHALHAIPHRHLVFDLVDDLAAYGGHEEGMPHVERAVSELVRRSDLLVVTAKTLHERYGPLASRVAHVPNGFDAGRYAASQPAPEPASLASIPRPILGFIGTIFAFLDFDLLEEVARSDTSRSVVLVGPVEASARPMLERLVRQPNVHHLGAQPQDSIPAFLAAFDVCLNIFRVGRAADSVIPLKVFEYLSAGKPVVSTSMRALEMEDAASEIVFATADEFNGAIERCLIAGSEPEAARRRREAVAAYSWERLFEGLDAAVGTAVR